MNNLDMTAYKIAIVYAFATGHTIAAIVLISFLLLRAYGIYRDGVEIK